MMNHSLAIHMGEKNFLIPYCNSPVCWYIITMANNITQTKGKTMTTRTRKTRTAVGTYLTLHNGDEAQKHIANHCQGGKWDSTKEVDANVSLFNFQCLVGMVETGEITYADLAAVGGVGLVASVAKHCTCEAE